MPEKELWYWELKVVLDVSGYYRYSELNRIITRYYRSFLSLQVNSHLLVGWGKHKSTTFFQQNLYQQTLRIQDGWLQWNRKPFTSCKSKSGITIVYFRRYRGLTKLIRVPHLVPPPICAKTKLMHHVVSSSFPVLVENGGFNCNFMTILSRLVLRSFKKCY